MQISDLERLFIYHSPQYPGFTSWCGLWTMRGVTWEPAPAQPNGLPYSGHPEVLMTSKGQLLHLATSGISCSLDQG
ncbi:MAG: hypothetical protein HYW07_16720, partial [Candidatus Latescibacteria bacterium]|nr:hypothetical protein [Candidatus Latescibacterota bacterium]